MTDAPNIIQGTNTGPYTVEADTILTGSIDGDTRVFIGHTLTIGPQGTVSGDLTVDFGAECRINGTVQGNVENSGLVIVGGTIVGSLRTRKPAREEILPGANIGQHLTGRP